MKKCLLLTITLIYTLAVNSQFPFKINYQAALRSENASFASKNIGLRISILDGSATGPVVYSETQTPRSDQFGIISTVIGNGTVLGGQLSEVDWSAGTYFIRVEADPDGASNYTITGTSQLLSVPYALYSKNSGDGYPQADKTKLEGIEEGAEVNVNADWNADNGDAMILNKPVIDGSETKLNAGDNIKITGTGVSSDPYLISSAVPTPPGKIKGDIQYWDGSKWVLIPKGSYGQILTIDNNGLPSWQNMGEIPSIQTKNKYLKTSYELSNYEEWIHLNQVYKTVDENEGLNIFLTTELCQLDYDGDGDEDIFCADPDSLLQLTHPQILYRNTGGLFIRQNTVIPRTPGGKLLVGDFNNDSRPDIFSMSAFDLPNGYPSIYPSYLLINDGSGNFIRIEIPGTGHWYTGSSGDIDNDGDLDLVLFNFHVGITGEHHRILWNNRNGNFSIDTTGVGSINSQIDHCELADINNDGFLDLLINRPVMPAGYGTNLFQILWGAGHGFNEKSSSLITVANPHPICDLDVIDLDGDRIKEILFAVTPNGGGWEVNILKSEDEGRSFPEVTGQLIPENKNRPDDGFLRFLRIQDIDDNGRLDIFSTGKMENIRWEQDSDGIFKRMP